MRPSFMSEEVYTTVILYHRGFKHAPKLTLQFEIFQILLLDFLQKIQCSNNTLVQNCQLHKLLCESIHYIILINSLQFYYLFTFTIQHVKCQQLNTFKLTFPLPSHFQILKIKKSNLFMNLVLYFFIHLSQQRSSKKSFRNIFC